MDTSPVAELQGISFAYDQESVLQDIALRVLPGEFWGILGPNGAGKSTLLKIISGVLMPGGGQVKLFGRPLADWKRRELARLVALVPQRFELAFPFTVQEVVLLGRHPHRGPLALDGPRDLEAARRAMEATGTWNLRRRRFHELSGGEQKRVVVALALAQEPRLLLLDEPAAHLDIRHQVALVELIDAIRRESGLAVAAVMHDLNLAAAYCGRLLLLKQGRMLVAGALEEVMTYRNLREAFETDIYVGVNELTGHRLFVPMAGSRNQPPSTE